MSHIPRAFPYLRPRKVLDAVNERLASEEPPRTLHPTKGFRKLSAKRGRIQHLHAQAAISIEAWYNIMFHTKAREKYELLTDSKLKELRAEVS